VAAHSFFSCQSQIDQDVFIDDDGQAYIYYGGWGHANVALLNEDMTSFGTFPDGQTFKEITPEGYVEGAQMLKRNGKYIFMWSEGELCLPSLRSLSKALLGGWTGPDYAVSYAIADSPLGPFNRQAKILAQDSAVATGSGHNGVLNVPGTDIYYIIYHRRPLGETDGNHRVLCYDRMYFEEDGTIRPIVMEVQDDFSDGQMIAWKTYGGGWEVKDEKALVASLSAGGKAMLNTNFGDQVFDADVTLTGAADGGNADAGVVFRATGLGVGADAYTGYYAGLSPHGYVVLGKANGGWQRLATTNVTVDLGTTYHLRVTAIGSDISVYLGSDTTPKITVSDSSYSSGANGLRVFETEASFAKISVAKP